MTVAMTDKGWTMTKEQEEWWKVNGPLLVQEHVTEFREAYLRRGETGERAAYIKAIRALLGVLGLIPEHHGLSDGEPACMWFFDLTRHLEDLDTGVVPPAFRVRDVQRSALSTVEWTWRRDVVVAIEMVQKGGMTYRDAARRAIRGFKLRGVSEKEVNSWRKEF